jgi:Protein of unknown function (DUF4240)
MMDEDGFWKIVQIANDGSGGDMDRKCSALRQQIAALQKDEPLGFAQQFDAMMDKAYNWPLWGAAYVINGGCSDDSFADFRASLISRGRAAFERALADRTRSQARILTSRTGSTKAMTTPSRMASKRSPETGRSEVQRLSRLGRTGRKIRSPLCFRNSPRSLGKARWFSRMVRGRSRRTLAVVTNAYRGRANLTWPRCISSRLRFSRISS